MRQQRVDIADVRDTARSDDRDRDGAGESDGGFDIAAAQHAVAADVGEEERGDTGILETAGEIGDGDGRDIGPAFGGDETVAGIDADDDASGEVGGGAFDEIGVL